MLQRLSFALFFACLGFAASTGISEAAKGPDAHDVALGTFVGVLIAMTVLGLLYLLKVALGSPRVPPPEEPGAGAHH